MFEKIKNQMLGSKTNYKSLQKSIGKDDLKNFSSSVYTEEIIENEEFIKSIKSVPYELKASTKLLQKCIEYGRIDLITEFSSSTYTEEIIESEKFIKSIKSVPYGLKNSTKLLQKCIKYGRIDLITEFSSSAYTEEIIENEEFIKSIKSVPYELKTSTKLLQKCIEHRRYDLINLFSSSTYTEEIKELIIKNKEFIMSMTYIPNVLKSSSNFFQKCIEHGRYDLMKEFKKEAYDSDSINLLSRFLSQKLNCSHEEIEYKINYLFNKNNEIFFTLDLRLLGKKYNFFNIEFIEKIGNYQFIQEGILKLNEQQLLVLSKISNLLTNTNYDLSPILEPVLKNITIYESLIDSINENELTEEQLKNLVYILRKNKNIYDIIDINQLTELNFKNIKEQYRSRIDNLITSGNIKIDQIKEAIFEEKFGLSVEEANFIIKRYCHDFDGIENSSIDENIKLILKSINDIANCDDLNKLINYYNSMNFIITDFYAYIFLESVVRNEYIKEYDSKLYKLVKKDRLIETLHNNPKLNELEHIRALADFEYLGKKPEFYILDDDFNMLIHVLNAYSKRSRRDNFKDEWEIPLIEDHGLCTSYIGNNQIAIAEIKSIVLGFSRLEGGSIYRAGNYDLGSLNTHFSISTVSPDNFLTPNKMIDNTRHTHNEIVIERRNTGLTESFKRMPDYLVLFVDDINDRNNFDPSKNEHYKYTLQASVDFNIPIVIVDRLKYAKREYKKCEKLLIEFLESFDTNKLNELLLTFFNNAIGCKCYTDIEHEYNKIFNQKSFDNLYQKIIDFIGKQNNIKKLDLFSKLLSYLEIEKSKQGEEITINLEEKIKSLKDNIEQLKKYQINDFIKINDLEDFERMLLSLPIEQKDNESFIILYSNNMIKVDLSKASFKKVPELAGASFLNRMKLLEVLSGKYIPISDLSDNILFEEEEYNKMRKKMSGLSQYNSGNFVFSDNLYFPQLDDYLSIIDDNLKNNSEINSAINNNIVTLLSSIGMIKGKDIELINTGSTARGTNIPNDIDFDYVMKIDFNNLEHIKQVLLANLPCMDKKIMNDRIRLKQVKIEGLDKLVDIDITFVSQEKYYSSDIALLERLEQIKKQDYEKYRLILANIMYAKKILKESNVYKASRSDKTQAGLGGIGVENWILQNGGSLIEASIEFLEYSKDTDFIEFEKKYFVNDYGKNHVSMTRHQFPYDNYVMKNMRENGYKKMCECLQQFLQSIENRMGKGR